MSETVARQRPPVDLDDFERRFRQTQHPAAHDAAYHSDDPLAELARIVGDEHDPYGEVFAQPSSGHVAPEFRQSFAPHGRQEPSFGDTGPGGDSKPRFMADFAAIEAGLRGALAQPQAPHFQEPRFGHDQHAEHDPRYQDQLAHPQVAPGHDMQADYAEPDYAFPPEPQAQADWAEPVRAPKKRGAALKPAYAIAGSIAIAVVGIGVAFAYKGVGSSPREIKTIMAAAGPTKVQPPADAKTDATEQDAQSQAAPTKLVSREEQPVDLQQAVQDNAARDVASRGPDAGSVPVPEGTMSPDYSAMGGAKTTDTPTTGSASQQSYGDQGFGVGMPLPKKVKSVMVKPDGTIVSGTQEASASPAPAPTAAAPAEDRIGALVGGATPAPTTPKGHAKGAKATARVATAAPAAEPTDGADAAPAPAKPAKKTKPVKVATAETGTEPQAANDAGDEAKPSGNGGFAVQLGAPGSEAEARSATSKFLKKYAGALRGQRLGFHRADSNGKTVYRIRVSSLSKADAASLCSKLKADGGTCFVAKN